MTLHFIIFVMSLQLGGRNIELKATGTRCSVPNTPEAKLKFYLSNVNCLVDFDIPYNYRNYNEPCSSLEEKENLLALAVLLSIDIFIEAKVMIHVDSLPGGFQNEFYELTDRKLGFYADNDIVIAGRHVKVLKFMAFTDSYLLDYVQSLKDLDKEINSFKEAFDVSNTSIGCCLLL